MNYIPGIVFKGCIWKSQIYMENLRLAVRYQLGFTSVPVINRDGKHMLSHLLILFPSFLLWGERQEPFIWQRETVSPFEREYINSPLFLGNTVF